ncbi:type IV pilus modification protein PilV [Pseudoxanthomonas sp.]|uniref:type IV pilus modification protein PilV n=1 Tax=Pseudoxanthomonas sp. TaxID=1871049 RepID=UPI002628B269|nr:type IV pilus modification protein PilV [Pseudoxanthomonas sp.]WDS36038.1 MAG: type IV pilus modification protein PilV [Pseudoxanthomonas sp.]
MRRPISFHRRRHGQAGFTLIEVMIAVLVLGVGLLGFAMLQTMSVRFTKSAQNRTVATNLSYELVDLIRTQRNGASNYNAIKSASFSGVTGGNCALGQDTSPANNIARWKCKLRTVFPDGTANVALAANGDLVISIEWSDAYWEEDADKQKAKFEVKTRI